LRGFFVEELQEAFRDHLVEFLDERFVLHRLARDVERKILAIDDALEKAKPLGK
jgi:hypothetical protein